MYFYNLNKREFSTTLHAMCSMCLIISFFSLFLVSLFLCRSSRLLKLWVSIMLCGKYARRQKKRFYYESASVFMWWDAGICTEIYFNIFMKKINGLWHKWVMNPLFQKNLKHFSHMSLLELFRIMIIIIIPSTCSSTKENMLGWSEEFNNKKSWDDKTSRYGSLFISPRSSHITRQDILREQVVKESAFRW